MKLKYFLAAGLAAVVLAVGIAMTIQDNNPAEEGGRNAEVSPDRTRSAHSSVNSVAPREPRAVSSNSSPGRHADPLRAHQQEVWQDEMSQLVARRREIESEMAVVSRQPEAEARESRLKALTNELAEITNGIAAVESAMELE